MERIIGAAGAGKQPQTAKEIVEIEKAKLLAAPGIAEKYGLTLEEAKALIDFAHDTASMGTACMQQIVDVVIQCRDNLVPKHMTFLRLIELLREVMNMNALGANISIRTIEALIVPEPFESMRDFGITTDFMQPHNREEKRAREKGKITKDPGQTRPWQRKKFYERGPQ